MIKIAIVDDDAKNAEQLADFCKKYAAESGKALTHYIYKDGLSFLEQYRPFDIIFMDIEMPLMNGLDTAKKIRKIDEKAIIIFVTIMAQYAIKGYEVNALDFVIKPVNWHSFAFKLKKAVSIAENSQKSEVLISFERNLKRLDVANIYYVENTRHRVLYHTHQGPVEEYTSLAKAEKRLSENRFVRCNNYCLVNLDCVTEIKNMSVVVKGKELPMSRSKKREFINKLTTFIGGGYK